MTLSVHSTGHPGSWSDAGTQSLLMPTVSVFALDMVPIGNPHVAGGREGKQVGISGLLSASL